MTPEQEKSIARWGQALANDIELGLVLTEDERSKGFENFVDRLTAICPKIHVKIERDDESSVPGIKIGNILYHAIPLERELDPFLNLMADPDTCSGQTPVSIRDRIDQIQFPALLKVYITPRCPFCPATVRQLISLALANELIALRIVDGFLFADMAAADNIHSAPTVLLDEQFRWSGSIQMPEIVDIILNRDPSQLSSSSLTSLIKDGSAAWVAEMMLESDHIFPAFMELLVHEKWPIRLGAMVAFETIAEKNRQLLVQTIPFLWDKFLQADDAVKGDILYLYGQLKNEHVISKLKSVVAGYYSEQVKEAAVETLQELDVDI